MEFVRIFPTLVMLHPIGLGLINLEKCKLLFPICAYVRIFGTDFEDGFSDRDLLFCETRCLHDTAAWRCRKRPGYCPRLKGTAGEAIYSLDSCTGQLRI